MPRNNLLKFCRLLHLYFGVFISPALLFFAFTGAVQTLSLHEAAGSSYKPPAWLAVWGQIHKKQTWQLPVRRSPGHDGHVETAAVPASVLAGPTKPGREDVRHDPADAGTTGRDAAGGRGTHPDRTPGEHSRTADAVSTPAISAAPVASAAGASQTGQPVVTLKSKQRQHLPLKLFFLVVSLGLFSSTVTGIYMSYKYDRKPLVITALLLAGVLLPLALLPF